MTASALGFMVTVWALIISATAYCFWRLLTSDRQLDGDDPDAPADR